MNSEKKINPLLLINRITLELSRTYDSKILLEKIIDFCMELSGATSGTLMIVDKEKNILDIKVSRGFTEKIQKDIRLKVGEGITGLVAKTGKAVLANNIYEFESYIPIKKNIKSELAVPLAIEEEVIGVISVDSTRLNNFTKEHLEFIQILSSQAAQIFKNINYLEELDKQNKIQKTLLRISQLLGSSSNLKNIFQKIMHILQEDLNLLRGTIYLYNEKDHLLEIAEGIGLSDKEMSKGSYSPGEGVTGKVFSGGQPYFIRRIQEDSRIIHKTGARKKIKEPISYYCCPIKQEGKIVGVLSIDKIYTSESDFQNISKFIIILSSIISQAFQIKTLLEEEKKHLEIENVILKREIASKYTFRNIIGRSVRMEALFKMIDTVSDSKANIFITGENGTGKELVASAIHYNSPRTNNALVKINCASIPENLLESELFGHKKGAFTGAISDKKGKFEIANGGSIFLDEIGDLDLNLQAKLLRVLQEREMEPIGSNRSIKVDVRIIAATNRNLETLVAEKKFREDLYFRLNVIRLEIPALRERLSDIPLLANFFIQKYAQENKKNIQGISKDAIKKLQSYSWPGNVRELENMIERAIILSENKILQSDDFDFQTDINTSVIVDSTKTPVEASPIADSINSIFEKYDGNVYQKAIEETEKTLILKSLKKFRYVKSKAARFLGITRNTLDKKIKNLKLDY